MSGCKACVLPFSLRVGGRVELDFEPKLRLPLSFFSFLLTASLRLRLTGSQRSQKTRLEIFRCFGPLVQPIVSAGLDSQRRLARCVSRRCPKAGSSSRGRGGRSALSAPYGN